MLTPNFLFGLQIYFSRIITKHTKISLSTVSTTVLRIQRFSNLVPRVSSLFGQRVGARRDSGDFENIKIFWLAAPLRLPLFYRRNPAVPAEILQFPSLLATNRWPKSLSTLGTRLAFLEPFRHAQNVCALAKEGNIHVLAFVASVSCGFVRFSRENRDDSSSQFPRAQTAKIVQKLTETLRSLRRLSLFRQAILSAFMDLY